MAEPPRKGFVLINETGFAAHHGSRTVSAVIHRGLAARGFTCLAATHAGAAWWEDAAMRAALPRADLVVVNAEGSIHHGAPPGAALMRVLEPALRPAAPVAFVNMLWQDNPDEWATALKGADLVSVRDKASRDILSAAGVEARFVPDLSLSDAPADIATGGAGPAFGDSIDKGVSRALARAAAAAGAPVLPVRASLRHRRPRRLGERLDNLRHALKARFLPYARPPQILFPEAEGFCRALARYDLYVTGRFHGACLALRLGVPFLAVASNSAKIERLLSDAGLDPGRMVDVEALDRALDQAPGWSAPEQAAREAFLAGARTGAAGLLDDMATLAG